MKNNRLVMTVIAFAGVIAGILLVNRWIDREIKDIAIDLPAPVLGTQTVEKTQLTGSRPRPVVIDPLNDPLAPVIPRKKPESTDKKAAPPQTSPQRIYEPAEENVILTQ
ncbi:MAG: hypothetical protein HY210_01235 [Candidatus Omnitrophica bacterium]|nr:hypothetical protein [Candidatus Omnitrophota bacterium]MBI5024371.1 hypothetical protein [Candidatus Omnitrophota bacterium]